MQVVQLESGQKSSIGVGLGSGAGPASALICAILRGVL